jgi:hypothetical protein
LITGLEKEDDCIQFQEEDTNARVVAPTVPEKVPGLVWNKVITGRGRLLESLGGKVSNV